MKVLITSLLLIFASATALASLDPLDITVQRDVTSNTMIVRSTLPLESAASFALLDASGNRVYADSLRGGTFLNKRFPLTALPGNSYRLVLTGATGRTTLPLRLNGPDGQLVNYDKAARKAFPHVKLREQTLVVGYDNTSGKRVSIRIANEQGETVFSDRITGTVDVQRAYELSNLAEGAYEVTVSAHHVKSYTTAIALR